MQHAGILVGVVLAHLVACYQPNIRDCAVRCSAADQCAAGQVCRDDGWCAAPGLTACEDGAGDNITEDAAAVTADIGAGPGDAPDLCSQGCSRGTCVAGVCVIDCSAPGSCTTDVLCPANLPCRVVCGDSACSHKILCNDATTCTVECTGIAACGDEIQCNADTCSVTCSGSGSCEKRTRCADACACDVTCSGLGSCLEVSECPASACRVGNGCSSSAVGCDCGG